MTEFRKTDEYEDMAATFQVMMFNWLNDALQKAGVTDKPKRKEICEDFGFMFSVWKDQYWFKDSQGNRIYPCIAFASNGPVTDKGKDDLGTVYLPSGLFSFKEYLHGNLDYYFEEHSEEISQQIETGIN